MLSFQEVVDEFRRECAEDYVGLWQISRALKSYGGGADHLEEILSVVSALLEKPGIVVGQFENDRFVEWGGSDEEHVDRLRRELFDLGKEPDIGDVAWLIQRADQPITGEGPRSTVTHTP
jgi:hypothetical protein